MLLLGQGIWGHIWNKHAWNYTTFSHTAVDKFENTHKKRVGHFPEVSSVCLCFWILMTIWQCIKVFNMYRTGWRLKGEGRREGGVAYPPVMEKICMMWFLNKENPNLIRLINQKNQFLNLVCLIIMYNSQAAIILMK